MQSQARKYQKQPSVVAVNTLSDQPDMQFTPPHINICSQEYPSIFALYNIRECRVYPCACAIHHFGAPTIPMRTRNASLGQPESTCGTGMDTPNDQECIKVRAQNISPHTRAYSCAQAWQPSAFPNAPLRRYDALTGNKTPIFSHNNMHRL